MIRPEMITRANILCPNCSGPLVPTELSCPACELSIRGRFSLNEFASLPEDDLHFLRIFVRSDGRIRDMESALGVSYPTVKARLAKLKETLAVHAPPAAGEFPHTHPTHPISPSAGQADEESAAAQVLADLKTGRIGYPEALEKLRLIAKENPT